MYYQICFCRQVIDDLLKQHTLHAALVGTVVKVSWQTKLYLNDCFLFIQLSSLPSCHFVFLIVGIVSAGSTFLFAFLFSAFLCELQLFFCHCHVCQST